MFPAHRKSHTLSYCASLMLLAGCVGAVPAQAYALGADYGPDDFKMHPGTIGGQTPIHGYWVNWEDVFFYAGDADAFNAFIGAYSKFRHCKLQVVLHRGPKQAASPWRQLDTPADWSLYVWNTGAAFLPKVRTNEAGEIAIEELYYEPTGEPAPTRVDVWIGGRLKLHALHIPAALAVTAGADAAQDAEINRFIAERTAPPAAAPPAAAPPAAAPPAAAPYEPPVEAATDVFRLSVE